MNIFFLCLLFYLLIRFKGHIVQQKFEFFWVLICSDDKIISGTYMPDLSFIFWCRWHAVNSILGPARDDATESSRPPRLISYDCNRKSTFYPSTFVILTTFDGITILLNIFLVQKYMTVEVIVPENTRISHFYCFLRENTRNNNKNKIW